jgi:hypothetical protein
MGDLLQEMAASAQRDSGRGDRKAGSHSATPQLRDLGVTKDQSTRFQQAAKVAGAWPRA